jgi:hypothetical protein
MFLWTSRGREVVLLFFFFFKIAWAHMIGSWRVRVGSFSSFNQQSNIVWFSTSHKAPWVLPAHRIFKSIVYKPSHKGTWSQTVLREFVSKPSTFLKFIGGMLSNIPLLSSWTKATPSSKWKLLDSTEPGAADNGAVESTDVGIGWCRV